MPSKYLFPKSNEFRGLNEKNEPVDNAILYGLSRFWWVGSKKVLRMMYP